jgi:hypothetical protein
MLHLCWISTSPWTTEFVGPDREATALLPGPSTLAPDESPFAPGIEERIAAYQQKSKAAATWRAYQSDWNDFAAWCQQQGRTALPTNSDTLGAYLSDRARPLAVRAGEKSSHFGR